MRQGLPHGARVAVTGANGYIGSHIVQQLLNKGYRVRAVVRDPKQEERVAHLRAFAHSDHLELAKGELKEEDYRRAFEDCQGVIHVATPFIYTAPDPERDIVQPAIAALANRVQRIVVTSSGGSIYHFPVPQGFKFSANDWNTMSTLQDHPYWVSKRKSEEAAWAFAKEHKEIEVTVVNPTYVLGPLLSDHPNQTIINLKKLLMGEPGYLPLTGFAGSVDVRDVAKAHVIAVEHPDAAGKRLFCANRVLPWAELPVILKRLFPQYPNTVGPAVEPPPWSIDTQPLADLGLSKYIDTEQMLKDCVASMVAHKVIPQL